MLSDWKSTLQNEQSRKDQMYDMDFVMTEAIEYPCSLDHPMNTESIPIEVDPHQINNLGSWNAENLVRTTAPQTTIPRGCFSYQDPSSPILQEVTTTPNAFSTANVGNVLDTIQSPSRTRTQGTYEARRIANKLYRVSRIRGSSRRHTRNVLHRSHTSESTAPLISFAARDFQVQESTGTTASQQKTRRQRDVARSPSSTFPSLPLWSGTSSWQDSNVTTSSDPNDINPIQGGFSQKADFQAARVDEEASYQRQQLFESYHLCYRDPTVANSSFILQ